MLLADLRPSAEPFLRRYLAGDPAYSFGAVRGAAHAIYGVKLPLVDLPRETWEQIETLIKEKARPHEFELNIKAAKLLVKLVSSRNFDAYPYPKQFIQVGAGRIVPIGLSYYLVENDRLIFQYLQPRAEPAFDDRTALVLVSLVKMAYAFGDYSDASIEIADLSAIEANGPRKPRFRQFERSALLTADDLNAEISDVYAIMKRLYDEA